MLCEKGNTKLRRYSVRTLLLVVTTACICCGLVERQAQRYRREAAAILEIQEFATVEVQAAQPEWFWSFLGMADAGEVIEISLNLDKIRTSYGTYSKIDDDALLERVSRFASLKSLYLYWPWNSLMLGVPAGTPEEEADRLYRELTTLPFRDESLDYLFDLKNLRVVNVGRTEITDAGATRLRRALPQCAVIGLHSMSSPIPWVDVDDPGFEEYAKELREGDRLIKDFAEPERRIIDDLHERGINTSVTWEVSSESNPYCCRLTRHPVLHIDCFASTPEKAIRVGQQQAMSRWPQVFQTRR